MWSLKLKRKPRKEPELIWVPEEGKKKKRRKDRAQESKCHQNKSHTTALPGRGGNRGSIVKEHSFTRGRTRKGRPLKGWKQET